MFKKSFLFLGWSKSWSKSLSWSKKYRTSFKLFLLHTCTFCAFKKETEYGDNIEHTYIMNNEHWASMSQCGMTEKEPLSNVAVSTKLVSCQEKKLELWICCCCCCSRRSYYIVDKMKKFRNLLSLKCYCTFSPSTRRNTCRSSSRLDSTDDLKRENGEILK
jgi:hypothetical protein